MKLKRLLYLFVIGISLNQISIQKTFCQIKIDGKSFPSPTVEKVIEWLEMPTSQWETEIKPYFAERGVSENCVYHGSGNSLTKKVLTYKKCPGPIIVLDWVDLSGSKSTVFDSLVDQLEPYFLRYQDGTPVYGFEFNDQKYEFSVSRGGIGEMIFVYKLK